MLLGRSDACSQLLDALEEARRGSGRAMAVVGPAGIGKTALLQFVESAASDLRLIRMRATPTEADVSYAGLSHVLSPLLDRLPSLPRVQREAVEATLALGVTRGGEAFPIWMGTLNLLTSAAGDRPLVILVDDAHWLDIASANALLFAETRIAHDPVVLVLAYRTSPDLPAPPAQLRRLELEGLDQASAAAMVSLGHGDPTDRVVRWLVTATGGNPLALRDLPRYMSASDLAMSAARAQPAPIGPALEAAYGRTLIAMPQATQLASAIAALLDGSELRVFARALQSAGLSTADVEPAEDADLLSLADGVVTLRHPLIRSAAIQLVRPSVLRAARYAAADGLLASARPRDRDLRVWHLAEAAVGEDEATASLLEELAAAACLEAGYAAAGSTYEKAAALGGRGVARTRRLVAAAEATFFAGELPRCRRLLDQADHGARDPRLADDVEHLRARLQTWSGQPAVAADRMMGQARRLRAVDPARSIRLSVDAAAAAALSGQMTRAFEAASLAASLAADAGPVAGPVGDLLVGAIQAMRGDGTAARHLLDRCLAVLTAEDLTPEMLEPLVYLATSYQFIDCFAEAASLFDRAIALARGHGAIGQLPFALAHLASSQFRVGDWESAYANATEALELAQLSGRPADHPIAAVIVALVEAGRGDHRARERASMAIDEGTALGTLFVVAQGHSVLGLLDLGIGRPADAVDSLRTCRSMALDLGLMELGYLQWAAELVEALVRSGRSSEAEETLEIMRSSAHPGTTDINRAILARCEGLVAVDCWEDPFVRSLEIHHASCLRPFELARTELCYGERLRRSRRRKDARLHLGVAWGIFAGIGAHVWADRAAHELRATGSVSPGQVRHSLDLLTPQEFRVATAVADGLSNRAVANTLFLSQKTVEFHLSAIYRRTGMRSRAELARAVSERSAMIGPGGRGQDQRHPVP